jgi:undecaprenyl-diphosphatase
MNAFDLRILSFINQFAHHSKLFDHCVVAFEGNNLLVYVPIMMIWSWKWFSNDSMEVRNRKLFVSTIIGCIFIAISFFVIRDMRFLTEFRPRPMLNPQINFQIPYGMEPKRGDYILSTSSFPSGHAALLFGLTFNLIYVSRRLGASCLVFSLIVTLGRIFLGIHYPTDIIVGAFLGAGIVYIANGRFISNLLTRPIIKWSNHHPSSFYAAFFFITFNVADSLSNIAMILKQFLQLFRHFVNQL